ncbi:hypothetical protein HPMBJEAJ_00031 [Aeromonas phage avDM6]|nr:hypothetical protein HPMBJEAJ_00031 [Aeromonas phage avDM6]
MNIKITTSGFSTLGMFGQNHRLIEINGVPLLYTCTAYDINDPRVFVLESNRQLNNIVKRNVVVDTQWVMDHIDELTEEVEKHNVVVDTQWVLDHIDELIEEAEKHNSVYIYCVTTSGMIVRPSRESFSWGAANYISGHSTDTFDMSSDLFVSVMKDIIENDEITRFYFVDSITGKELS